MPFVQISLSVNTESTETFTDVVTAGLLCTFHDTALIDQQHFIGVKTKMHGDENKC